jgi:hypothetical protein
MHLLQTSAAAQAAVALEHPQQFPGDLYSTLLHSPGERLIHSHESQISPADQNVNTLA